MLHNKTLSWTLNALMALGLGLGCGLPKSGPLRSIELMDGSLLVGEILSADQGTYTVKTTFGMVTLKDSDIRSINSRVAAAGNGLAGTPTVSSPDTQSLETIQQRILANPDMAKSLNALQDDPEIQQVLHDPNIMEAIQKGDLEYLQSNPRIGDLMRNPTMQDLSKKLEP